MNETYWERTLGWRIRRRRLLGTAGAGVLGAAVIAACGGGSGSGGSAGGQAASSLVSPVADETKDLKRGGILRLNLTADIESFDPHNTSLPSQVPSTLTYNQLWRVADGHLEPANGMIEGDLVESWEFSPDKLQLTAKINPNAHWAPLPPVNGRSVDARDVESTWTRFAATGSRRTDLANDANPGAPVVSLTATDDRTVVMKLKSPNATLTALFAQIVNGSFYVLPKEAEDRSKLDISRTQLGSGPWYLANYTPSVSLTYKRNPGFKQDKRDLPYADGIEYPIVPEYATVLSQFRAGSIYTYALQAEDILPAKRDIPALLMQPADLATAGTRNFFGVTGADSPFKDVRVRQAWSMSIDRDLFIDVIYNVSKFKSEGLPVQTAWDTALPANTYAGWWLDPKGKDFGLSAKNYSHDIAQAKQLLAAGGFPNGVEVNVYYPANGYAPAFYKHVDTVLAMVGDAGFRPKINTVNFASEWPKFRVAKGNFDGTAFITDSGGADPTNFLLAHYNSSGSLFQGGDAKMDDLTSAMLKEFDDDKRRRLALELQQHEGEQIFYPRVSGGATGFNISWPVLRNQQVWRGGTGRVNATVWLDPTQPPLKQS